MSDERNAWTHDTKFAAFSLARGTNGWIGLLKWRARQGDAEGTVFRLPHAKAWCDAQDYCQGFAGTVSIEVGG
jgi:hypothetical protein